MFSYRWSDRVCLPLVGLLLTAGQTECLRLVRDWSVLVRDRSEYQPLTAGRSICLQRTISLLPLVGVPVCRWSECLSAAGRSACLPLAGVPVCRWSECLSTADRYRSDHACLPLAGPCMLAAGTDRACLPLAPVGPCMLAAGTGRACLPLVPVGPCMLAAGTSRTVHACRWPVRACLPLVPIKPCMLAAGRYLSAAGRSTCLRQVGVPVCGRSDCLSVASQSTCPQLDGLFYRWLEYRPRLVGAARLSRSVLCLPPVGPPSCRRSKYYLPLAGLLYCRRSEHLLLLVEVLSYRRSKYYLPPVGLLYCRRSDHPLTTSQRRALTAGRLFLLPLVSTTRLLPADSFSCRWSAYSCRWTAYSCRWSVMLSCRWSDHPLTTGQYRALVAGR